MQQTAILNSIKIRRQLISVMMELRLEILAAVAQWQSIVVNANKAGARTCEYMGAMEAFKHLNNTIFD